MVRVFDGRQPPRDSEGSTPLAKGDSAPNIRIILLAYSYTYMSAGGRHSPDWVRRLRVSKGHHIGGKVIAPDNRLEPRMSNVHAAKWLAAARWLHAFSDAPKLLELECCYVHCVAAPTWRSPRLWGCSSVGQLFRHRQSAQQTGACMTARSLTYARMAQPFVHAPLFRSFAKGEQARYKLDVTYQYTMRDGSRSTYRFWGPEPLGATDLLVLQGLVAVATGRLSMPGGVKQMLRDGRSQRAHLVLTEDAYTERTVAARFVLYGFALALGYSSPSGSTLERLRRSIERMSAVTVLAASPKFRGSFHLLSGYAEDSATGEVVVGLNPHLTGSVLERTGYLRVNFDEVQKLKADAARLIHSRLHWINQGDSRVVGVSTLSEYVYCG